VSNSLAYLASLIVLFRPYPHPPPPLPIFLHAPAKYIFAPDQSCHFLPSQVLVSYLDKKLNRTSRRLMLKRNWGFDCTCSLCLSGK
jgi:hypothetical protein